MSDLLTTNEESDNPITYTTVGGRKIADLRHLTIDQILNQMLDPVKCSERIKYSDPSKALEIIAYNNKQRELSKIVTPEAGRMRFDI